MATKTLLTVEQFLQSPEYLAERTAEGDPRRYELDEGEMIEMCSATIRHNYTRRQILVHMTVFLAQTELGEVFDETDIRLDSNTLYKPDIVYWDAQHAATIDASRIPVEIIPQFVVEVVSPSNTYRELLRRANKYRRAGVDTVWIVNDDPLEIRVFDPSGQRIVTAGESLTLPSLLPGFSLESSRLLPRAGTFLP